MINEINHQIKSISLKRLFGSYDYSFPSSDTELTDINIIYGPNGIGKTTLLKLVFHILSPEDSRNHKTYVSEVPFLELVVTLNDETKIVAKKNPQLLIGPVDFSIQEKGKRILKWSFVPGTKDSERFENLPPGIETSKLPISIREGIERTLEKKHFLEQLNKLNVVTYLLTADRILQSDSISRSSEKSWRDYPSRGSLHQLVADYRVESLNEVLRTAALWIRNKLLDRTLDANISTSSLYAEVIAKIAKSSYRTKKGLNKEQEAKIRTNLATNIEELEESFASYGKYGLVAPLQLNQLLPILQAVNGNRLFLIETILSPYLAALKARSDSLNVIYQLINNFVNTLNKFLADKRLTYSMRTGFLILLDLPNKKSTTLDPEQLSSGEQQLILLFSNILTARDKPSIFIIDEPEISLNITWQRKLIDSLKELSKGASIQFFFASHSLEILSKHRNRVISLNETIS